MSAKVQKKINYGNALGVRIEYYSMMAGQD